MTIRYGTLSDLDELTALFDDARAAISRLGIDQWQDGYPERSVIEEDIRLGRNRVMTDGESLAGTFALIPDGEPTYDVITDGHWLTGDGNRSYLTVHRTAIGARYRGTGLSGRMMAACFAEARRRGLLSVRIDTHPENVVMRRMLEKNGMTACGTIFLKNGAPRVAYERLADFDNVCSLRLPHDHGPSGNSQ